MEFEQKAEKMAMTRLCGTVCCMPYFGDIQIPVECSPTARPDAAVSVGFIHTAEFRRRSVDGAGVRYE